MHVRSLTAHAVQESHQLFKESLTLRMAATAD